MYRANVKTTSETLVWKGSMVFLHCLVLAIGVSSETCNEVGTFKQFVGVTLPMCADECYRRKRCEVFMFHQRSNYCALKDDNSSLVSFTEHRWNDCSFFRATDELFAHSELCRKRECGLTERCYDRNGLDHECLKSECPSTTEIKHAVLMSNTHSIGSSNRYRCHKGLSWTGNPKTTCLPNATWSMTDFRCHLPRKMECPDLLVNYTSATMSDYYIVDGVGIVVTYTCREGFRNMSSSVNVTCQQSNQWDSKYIKCCHDNSTHYVKEGCVAIVNGGLITNAKGANTYCKNIGGVVKWPRKYILGYFDLAATSYVLVNTRTPWFQKNWNYELCAQENGQEGNSSFSLKQKVAQVQSNGWTNAACFWGSVWLPGQPDGGDEELCIARDVNQKGKFVDMQCNLLPPKVGFICEFAMDRTTN